jgi:adenine-specific DNA-methyltransferase
MLTEFTLPTEKVAANSEQLELLKKNFPNCFDKHGKFVIEKLQEILQAHEVEVSRESYSLNWLGKSYARVLANEPIRTMLSEDTEHNSQEQNKNSHNLLIQGDNLEVLKHLKGAYTDQIKMIYIDPPYNTGSDGFVYQDDRSFTPEQFADLAGVDLEEAKRVLDFTQSNANSHSAWLTFIYPRLYVAKQLLKDDGVIFISIDDNEQAQLKILCDEVFGEACFLTQFIWKRRVSSSMADYNVSNDHEYVLVYVKQDFKGLRGIPKDYKKYANPDNDPRGDWIADNLTVGMSSTLRPNQAYDLVDPSTGVSYPYNPNRVWAFVPESMKKMIEENRIIFPKDPSKRPMQKRFKNELKSDKNPFSSLAILDVALNTEATRQLQDLFKGVVFEYSKPVNLIKKLVEQVVEKNEKVLDFFAGSGTTAHAVLKQNAEDGFDRQFICVQIAEEIEKNKEAYTVGYRTIFEITKDRITKASEQLAQEYPESNFECGYKIFKTRNNFLPEVKIQQLTLNFDELQNTPDAHQVNLNFTEKLVSNDFSDVQLQDILTTWKGLDKILLSENLNKISLGEYQAYGFGHVLYLIHKGFNTNALKELMQKLDDEHTFQVSKIVMLGHNFDSKSQREIDEAMKNYNNKKSIPVDVVVRY